MARWLVKTNGLTASGASTTTVGWSVAAWIRPTSIGASNQWGGRIFSIAQSSNPWTETYAFHLYDSANSGNVGQLGASLNLSGTDQWVYSDASYDTIQLDEWQYVACSFGAVGGDYPKLFYARLGEAVRETPYDTRHGGAGSRLGGMNVTAVGSYASATSYAFDGLLAHVTYWTRPITLAEAQLHQTATLRAGTNPAMPITYGLTSYWPLGESSGTYKAQDYGPAARHLTANSGSAKYGVASPAPQKMWRFARWPLIGPASTTVTPSAVTASTSVPAPAVTVSGTVTPSAVTVSVSVLSPAVQTGTSSTATPSAVTASTSVLSPAITASSTATPSAVTASTSVPAVTVDTATTIVPSAVTASTSVPASTITASGTVTPSVVSATTSVPSSLPATAAARTLDGTNDGFECLSATAITTSTWSWCGHVTLDAVTGTHYLWYTETSAPTRVSSVSVEVVSGKYRLRAYQFLANYTYHQATWDLPLPTGTMVTIGVTFQNSNRSFRAYVGTDTIPMTELQWRSEMAQGTAGQAPYSAYPNSRWYISPSAGRVDGTVGHVCVTNDTLTLAEMDQIRRYGDPPTGSNLLGWWKFEEASGNAADSSGNSRTMAEVDAPGTTSRTTAAPAESSNALDLTSVVDWQLFQRDGSDEASVPLDGTYGGSPSSIQARFTALGSSPGSWTTVVASPSGGTYSGSLTVAKGQGTLEVRADHGGGSYSYVRRSYVAVGDLYYVIGTSNAAGYGTNSQSVAGGLSPWQFGSPLPTQLSNWDVSGTHQWICLGDPTDARQGTTLFAPSMTWVQSASDTTRETAQPGGTWLPQLAGRLIDAYSCPVAMTNFAHYGAGLNDWRKSTSTHWDEFVDRAEQVASPDTVPITAGAAGKAILAVMGENDYGGSVSTTYATYLSDWVDEMWTDFGLPTILMCVGDWPGTSAYQYTQNPNDGITLIRAAIESVAGSNSHASLGPVMYDVDLADESGDGYHYKTDTELATVADRWYAALAEEVYGATSGTGHGPRITACYRTSLTTATIDFDTDLDDPGGGYSGITVYHGSTNSAAYRLTWVASSPSGTQYTAERNSSVHSRVDITFGSSMLNTIWVGIGEYDLSVALKVPTVTRSIASVSVTLPAEVATDVAAMPRPGAATASVSVPVPAVSSSVTVTPSTVNATATANSAGVQTSGSSTAAPSTVTATVSVPTPALTASTTVVPSTVTASTTVEAPTIQASGSSTATPATVTASTTVLSPAATATATAAPTPIAASVSTPAAAISASATAAPSAVTASSTVAAPAIQTGSSTTVSASVVTSTTSTPAPVLVSSAAVTPATIAVSVAVRSPTQPSPGVDVTWRPGRRRSPWRPR
ncbi:MAG: hypothetical protein K1X95_03530 [Acidimicrobiia bacterium]|nr:hypothetical protein [Acidimicrobiia bacterium]